MAGTWTIEIRGARSVAAAPQASSPTQLAAPGPVGGIVVQVGYILTNIAYLAGHPQRSKIEAAIKGRVIDIYADGTFRPASVVTRKYLARSLVVNSSLRQSLCPTPNFGDVSGDLLNISEAVTARIDTSRLRFRPTGMVTSVDQSFNPTATVNRLDLAVALIKALGHDAAARALANSTVTSNGTILSDNAQIPAALRGYVQLAIHKGLFEAFPAEVRPIAPGQFVVVPGPRFEPANNYQPSNLCDQAEHLRRPVQHRWMVCGGGNSKDNAELVQTLGRRVPRSYFKYSSSLAGERSSVSQDALFIVQTISFTKILKVISEGK